MRTLIAIPCYNCKNQVARVMEKLKSETNLDTVFVDNKSTDGTARIIAQNLSPNQTLLKHDRNYGLGGSFRTICEYAELNGYDYLILLHGDDQASVDDLKRMVALAEEQTYDCVFGARFMPGSRLNGYSKIRSIGNKAINFVYSLALGKRVYEIGSGLNLYRISSLPLADIKRYPSHIAFDINLLFHYLCGPYRYLFLPIEWSEEDQVSNARNVKVGLTVLHMLLKHLAGIKDLSREADKQNYEIIRR